MEVVINLKKRESFQHGGGLVSCAEMKKEVSCDQNAECYSSDVHEYLVNCMTKHLDYNTEPPNQLKAFLKEMEAEDHELTGVVYYNGGAVFRMYDFRSATYRPFTPKMEKALIDYVSSLGRFSKRR